MTALATLAAALGGVLLWSFLEYALHAWAGHWARGRTDFSREHLAHHADTRYFSPARKKVRAATPAVAATALLGSALLGAPLGCAAAGGLALAYAGYEVLHRRLHTHPPRGPYGRWARKHHFHHHFAGPGTNHGVTSPIWDIVFGTLARPGRIRVPARHAMDWLLDPATGEVRLEHRADYEVAGRRAAAPLAPAAAGAGLP